jgi:hypothetical protein
MRRAPFLGSSVATVASLSLQCSLRVIPARLGAPACQYGKSTGDPIKRRRPVRVNCPDRVMQPV